MVRAPSEYRAQTTAGARTLASKPKDAMAKEEDAEQEFASNLAQKVWDGMGLTLKQVSDVVRQAGPKWYHPGVMIKLGDAVKSDATT